MTPIDCGVSNRKRLNHPNILGIHDICAPDGAPFLVSKFLEGQTLRER